jgi:hypothetical protein
MSVASFESAARTPPGPFARRAAVIAAAWLPAVVAAAALPRFVPAFDRWPWELPPLTAALMPFARLGVGPVGAAGVALVAALIAADVAWARAGLPGRQTVPAALAAAGLAAFAVLLWAALGPALTAPHPAAW